LRIPPAAGVCARPGLAADMNASASTALRTPADFRAPPLPSTPHSWHQEFRRSRLNHAAVCITLQHAVRAHAGFSRHQPACFWLGDVPTLDASTSRSLEAHPCRSPEVPRHRARRRERSDARRARLLADVRPGILPLRPEAAAGEGAGSQTDHPEYRAVLQGYLSGKLRQAVRRPPRDPGSSS
jgi:hypothetical protein